MLSRATWRRRLTFWGGALLIGLSAAAFAVAADKAQALFRMLVGAWPYLPLLLTPAGLVLSAWLARAYFPGSQGSGIPQAIAARHLKDPTARRALVSLRLAAAKVALTAFGLLVGASIGREGPTVQVGAAIMLAAGTRAGMGRGEGLILAGGAAGVAAAFNTPLAGIVFAIEEMARGFHHRTSGLVLSAVVLAGLAAMAILGNYNYFGRTPAMLVGPSSWGAVIATGIVGGLAGGIFSRIVVAAMRRLPVIGNGVFARRPLVAAALCGLAIAAIGIASGGLTYGTGYVEAKAALEGAAPLPWWYALAKMAATILSTISGIPGGIFSPSLSVGAGLGASLAWLAPGAAPGAVVVLGMAAYFAGAVQAPITAFVIVTEMVDNHAMIIPVMLASVIAYGASRLICDEPIYHALSRQFLARGGLSSKAGA